MKRQPSAGNPQINFCQFVGSCWGSRQRQLYAPFNICLFARIPSSWRYWAALLDICYEVIQCVDNRKSSGAVSWPLAACLSQHQHFCFRIRFFFFSRKPRDRAGDGLLLVQEIFFCVLHGCYRPPFNLERRAAYSDGAGPAHCFDFICEIDNCFTFSLGIGSEGRKRLVNDK